MKVDLTFQEHLGKYVWSSSSLLVIRVWCNVKEQTSDKYYVMPNFSQYVILDLWIPAINASETFIKGRNVVVLFLVLDVLP